jgi:glycine betaine/proline transport system substrate-binding protein
MDKHLSLRKIAVVSILTTSIFLTIGLGQVLAKEKIVFGDMSWDSVRVQNRIVDFIITHGLDYETDFIPGGTPIMVQSLINGDIDIDMESWTQNVQKLYDRGVAQGKIIDLGPSFPDSWQGWLVPTYIIEGDPQRGIEPSAPDLKSVDDLKDCWELFRDPEDPDKGRFYNAVAGWAVTEINEEKLAAYGLDEYYNGFVCGSGPALSGSMVAAYERGKPWVGYYWGPTWVLGQLDMTPLEEPAYDQQVWEDDYACAFPVVDVNILINHTLPERAPDVVEILKKYQTSMDKVNAMLAYMKNNEASYEQTAVWFSKNNTETWTKWVSPEVAAKVKAAL